MIGRTLTRMTTTSPVPAITSRPEVTYDVILGRTYTDPLTGFTGPATAVTVYLHACERVALEVVKDGAIMFESFDAPRLIDSETGQPVRLLDGSDTAEADTEQPRRRTGGPGGRESRQPSVERR